MKVFTPKYLRAAFALFATHFCVVAQNTPATVVPVQIINGLPYLEVTLNGKGPYLFGFDTGFGAELELDADLAATLNITPSGQTSIGDGSGRNEITLQTATINSLVIGNHQAQNCTAILRSNARKNVPGMQDVKGILGMGLFQEHKITIDYPKSLFLIQKGALPIADQINVLDYQEVGGGVPRIKIKVGNFDLHAVIDSRSMSGTFKIPQEIAEKLTFTTAPKRIGQGRTISNTIDINEVKIKENIRLGQLVFDEPTITYPSLNENVIIGSKLLQKFAVTIDSKNKRIQLTEGTLSVKQAEAKPTNTTLSEYTGQYGERTISVEDGHLYIQRPNGVLLKMLAKTKDEFTLERVPEAIIIFERDATNKVKSIKVSKGGNQWETAEKTNL